jgi:hypothetical protein
MKLDTLQKQSIKSLLRRMGSNQSELASAMEYQTGNLSEFLNENKNKGMRDVQWQRLLAELEATAQNRTKDGLIASDTNGG